MTLLEAICIRLAGWSSEIQHETFKEADRRVHAEARRVYLDAKIAKLQLERDALQHASKP